MTSRTIVDIILDVMCYVGPVELLLQERDCPAYAKVTKINMASGNDVLSLYNRRNKSGASYLAVGLQKS